MRLRRAGHNLLEVIIATVIFATAVVFLTGLWSTYHEALTKNRGRLIAMALGRSELESRIALGFTNLAPIFNLAPVETPYSFDAWIRGRTVSIPYKTYTKVSNTTPGPFARLAKIEVVVRWSEKSGSETEVDGFNKSVTYVAYVFDGR
ncbi:MAG: hypothetical protein KF760_19365 [Candidatus Eremiobacteraeota bacterium]|nr:hypothetical protein [Candidatus Eremiobacteraeota bacterium]MCW5868325.1 hypothetical protein [Candidatus Eremiobacteraeota bacterium]